MVKFSIISLFPKTLEAYLESSMLWKAQKDKKISVDLINLRDFADDAKKKEKSGKRRQIDDRPYGGGPGMVMKAEPLLRAVESALNSKLKTQSANVGSGRKDNRVKIVITSPRGKQFDNKLAGRWAKQYEQIIIIAGHYEGIDARVKKILPAEEVSIGPYTLTGGEVPSLVIVDAVTRQIDGVLGHPESLEEKREAHGEVYTRPEVIIWPETKAKSASWRTKLKEKDTKSKSYRVPKVLLSGNPKLIKLWRAKKSLGDQVTK